ncbi:tripartite tricarboxylate transporter TctB family protein [Staphylococcus agnetis]|uniref:tripartite tricarboxylate transporter TctB family protein n=1 Tax=Staphylococcus agnetis TaxID=985762 RepID=UPI00208E5C56|nr:tripartite tricarboxylate transporter TctB family protein [Staphylococcus agnetis]MCO4347157.1 tripartite tricarboxylate transporter TctB family protein [Staphylococcus agnetis]
MLRYVAPVVLFTIGCVYLIVTLNVPLSRIGDAQSPKYFPLIMAFDLMMLSLIYLFQEYLKRHASFDAFKHLFKGRALKLILCSIVLILLYALAFERIGFLISTTIFLGAMLFLINGVSHWLQNLIIAITFSGIAWYTFSQLLDVSLP